MNTTFSPLNPVLRFVTLVVMTVFVSTLGCGGCDDPNVTGLQSGRLLISPDPVAFPLVAIGESDEIEVVMFNTSDDPLTVYEIDLNPRGENGSIQNLELIGKPTSEFEIPSEGSEFFTIKYTPEVGAPPARAELTFISSDDRFTRDDPLRVSVDVLGNEPRLNINPRLVRFTRQAPGSRESQTVTIRNVGSAPLTLFSEPAYGGGEDFRISIDPQTYPLTIDVFDPESTTGFQELEVTVEYAPVGNGGDSGEIQIVSDDPTGDDGGTSGQTITTVDIAASADSPCILVDETTRNLGQVPIGSATLDLVTITNCGAQPLEVASIRLSENSPDDEFELDLGGWDLNGDGDIDNPRVIPAGLDEQFAVRYTPVQEGTDRGTIRIQSNDPLQSQLDVDLVARGSDGECPIAEVGALIKGVSSNLRTTLSAAPLQYIILDGTGSSDPDGRVVDYKWAFTQLPDGIAPQFEPLDGDPGDLDQSKRQFRLLTAGTYEIELTVVDNDGFESCDGPAKVTVRAVPNEKLLIELTWTNPEDPDETDSTGSDVDLHLVKMGPGEWFESPYDVFFRNPGGDTAGIWNPESPSLDIDDRDGGGPENIQMDDPANCEWYAVGVHYYKQLFGTAYATVRIFVEGNPNPVFEKINKPLTRGGEFWDVARIHFPSGQIYEADNLLLIEPAGVAPEVTAGMADSGLCTNQNLYVVQ